MLTYTRQGKLVEAVKQWRLLRTSFGRYLNVLSRCDYESLVTRFGQFTTRVFCRPELRQNVALVELLEHHHTVMADYW